MDHVDLDDSDAREERQLDSGQLTFALAKHVL